MCCLRYGCSRGCCCDETSDNSGAQFCCAEAWVSCAANCPATSPSAASSSTPARRGIAASYVSNTAYKRSTRERGAHREATRTQSSCRAIRAIEIFEKQHSPPVPITRLCACTTHTATQQRRKHLLHDTHICKYTRTWRSQQRNQDAIRVAAQSKFFEKQHSPYPFVHAQHIRLRSNVAST